jgi:CheY-like chemotaxis protein
LATIAGEAERIKTRLGPEHVSLRDLDRILSCVDRAADLVRQLQELGRGPRSVPKAWSDPTPEEVGTRTILLVEDDAHLRSRICQSLEGEGYTVLQAESGAEALEKAAGHPGPIHLMLGDLLLPGIGGSDLATRFCAARPEARVILMGAETGAEGDSSGVGTGRCVYLRKPFSLVSLRAKVREVLEADPARGESR